MRQPRRNWTGWGRRWSTGYIETADKRRRLPRRLNLEPLEPRRLLASIITEYPALSSGANGEPTQLTFGSDNNLWFTQPAANEIGIFDPTTHSVSEIATTVEDADPPGITATSGSGGAIWFTMSANFQLGKITVAPPHNPLAFKYQNPAYYPAAGITSIGNNIWITVPEVNGVEVLNSTASPPALSLFSLAPANINFSGFESQITAGPDGNLWFTEPGGIGIFSPTSDTVIGQVSLPNTGGGTQLPAAITVGPDGNIWFTESVPNSGGTGFVSSSVGVINTTTQKYVTEFATPATSQPTGITSGPDGNIWFSESAAGAIGIVSVNSKTDPTQDNLAPSLAIPTNVVTNPDPQGITTGPDGNIWFADSAGAIGVVNLSALHFVVTTPPPANTTAATGFTLGVSAENAANVVNHNFAGTATVALSANPGGSTLGGTLTAAASNGVATFPGLTLNKLGNGYTLQVTASGVTSVTTSGIDIVQAVYPAVADLGFQSPYVGVGTSGAFQIDPTGSAWTFIGLAGVAGNGSAYTSGNPSAPVGTQVGVIQQNGEISQTINLAAGTYTVSFAAAQRGNYNASSQTIEVFFDGTTIIGTFTPSGAGYTTFTSSDFTATAGAHSLSFVGLNPNGGDNTALIAAVGLGIANSIQDSGFESPNVGVGPNAFAIAPTGTPWIYIGDAGVAGNGSAYTAGNPSAPEGTQVGIIQQNGIIVQAVKLTAGTYTASFAAAQRGNYNASSQTFEVLFDGTALIGTFTPSGAGYTTFTTSNFTATAGAHTLDFVGLNPNGGDNTALIDQVVFGMANSVQVGGFETPSVGVGPSAFRIDPTGTAWTYTGDAGVAGNGSAYTAGNPSAPEGTQVGVIQKTGKMSQTLSNLGAGTYTVSFAAAQRGNYNASSQTIEVLLDGTTVLGVFTPAGTNYSILTTGPFTVTTPGMHTLAFVGLNPSGGDNTALIDQVALNQPGLQIVAYIQDPNFTSPSVGFGTSAIAADPANSPWTFTGSAGLTGNGSAFTSSNPPAPVGTQVAYIQQKGQISQTINSLAAGTYDLTLSAAQRGNFNASTQTFEVVVDSTVVGIFNPSGSGYTMLTTGPFTVAAGTHTLKFIGTDPSGGDNTVFISQLAINTIPPPAEPTVKDPNFQSPGVGVGTNATQGDPAGSPWTFTGSAGLTGNGSAFTAGNPSAPVGTQVAFIQEFGQISQSFTLAAGTYTLSFSAAQRANFQASSQTIEVKLDNEVIGMFTPGGIAYTTEKTSSFTVASSGSHTLTFVGLDPNGGDNTAFIDQVLIATA